MFEAALSAELLPIRKSDDVQVDFAGQGIFKVDCQAADAVGCVFCASRRGLAEGLGIWRSARLGASRVRVYKGRITYLKA